MLIAANVELLPTFGRPINPTSASTFRIIFNCLFPPFVPFVVFLGALLVEVLKRAFPNPGSPPEAILTDFGSSIRP